MNELHNQYEHISPMEEKIIYFIEIVTRTDLNSSWHHFDLLFEDRSDVINNKEDFKKYRKFQVYYKHKLSYEGHVYWKYPERAGDRLSAVISVKFDKILRGGESDLIQQDIQFEIDMMEHITEEGNDFFIKEVELPSFLSDYDKKRIAIILKKWGVHPPFKLSLEQVDPGQVETFIKFLISAAILLKAGGQRYSTAES
ncbi:hypothetical protein [Alkalicoccus halolimnae]|uniref:Uncharacterized protein n=1 Tax=Alkalicoccus halolimnae TaxID=1667239 RepID=A0A5C7FR58_9BACI|nr:hypothetical protein [Alkalicoccus halolimnae]TXF87195.1 hypothetical protein FTX54_00275 [Alkalicoccus halolimnae]